MIFLKLGSWLASQKADKNVQLHSRSPHGERGLKYGRQQRFRPGACGRSPHGERGLKSVINEMTQQTNPSLSSRRAWIEIMVSAAHSAGVKMSLSSRRAWIEIETCCRAVNMLWSLSSRRAWIEMIGQCLRRARPCVALLTESVD